MIAKEPWTCDPVTLQAVFSMVDCSFTLLCAAATCRLWHQLVYDMPFWVKPFDYFPDEVSPYHPTLFFKDSPVSSSFIGNLASFPSSRISHLLTGSSPILQRIRSLDLGKWMKNETTLFLTDITPTRLPFLESLSLTDCSILTDDHLLRISIDFPALRSLCISRCYAVTNRGIGYVAQRLQLSSLDIGDCFRCGNRTLKALADFDSATSMSLEFLSLRSPLRSNLDVKDSGLDVLTGIKYLRHLDLGWCRKLTDQSGQTLAILTQLKSLSLSRLPLITDGLIAALKPLIRLEVLDICRCDHISIFAIELIAEQFPDLTSLYINGNSFQNIPNGFRISGRLKNLHRLDAINTYLTDDIMEIISAAVPAVRQLSLAYNNSISDRSLRVIAKRMPQLELLNIDHCAKLTVAGIVECVGQLSNLAWIDLRASYNISDHQVVQKQLRDRYPKVTPFR